MDERWEQSLVVSMSNVAIKQALASVHHYLCDSSRLIMPYLSIYTWLLDNDAYYL